jgi:dihydromonapterin reductase/dihydrofolate reductase
MPPILITGAGRRVGLYLADALRADGYPILAHHRRPSAALEERAGHDFTLLAADLETERGILDLAEAVNRRTTVLRAIIHNASFFEPTNRNPHEVGDQARRFFQLHVLAPYLLNETLRPLLEACGDEEPADILHITDVSVHRPEPCYDLYCASKAGLANLTRSYAQRFAPRIKVNMIAPGPILFPDGFPGRERNRILARTPLATEGGPKAIYLAVRYLLENAFVTGTELRVDGGHSIVP